MLDQGRATFCFLLLLLLLFVCLFCLVFACLIFFFFLFFLFSFLFLLLLLGGGRGERTTFVDGVLFLWKFNFSFPRKGSCGRSLLKRKRMMTNEENSLIKGK